MCCAHPPARSAVCVPRRDTRWLPRHLGQRDSSRSAPSRFGRRGPLPRVRVEAGARAVYSALPPEAPFEPRCPVCLLEPQDQHPGTSVRSPCCPQGRRTTRAAGVRLHGAPSSRPPPRAPHGSSTKWTTTPPFYRWRALKKKKILQENVEKQKQRKPRTGHPHPSPASFCAHPPHVPPGCFKANPSPRLSASVNIPVCVPRRHGLLRLRMWKK